MARGNHRSRRASLKKKLNGLIKKTKELSVLCDMRACIIFFNREEDQLMVWPSPEAAKELTDNFHSLSNLEKEKKAVDPESVIKTNNRKIEKKLAVSRKNSMEFEMEHLMFQIQHGRELFDLSPTEVDNLISYSEKKIMCWKNTMDRREQLDTSLDEAYPADETMSALNVPSARWGGNSSKVMGTESIYYVDKWVTGLDLNAEPSDDDDEVPVVFQKGESSKAAGGTEDVSE